MTASRRSVLLQFNHSWIRSSGHRRELEIGGPLPRLVHEGDNLECARADSIGSDIAGTGNDQFPCPVNATGTTALQDVDSVVELRF